MNKKRALTIISSLVIVMVILSMSHYITHSNITLLHPSSIETSDAFNFSSQYQLENYLNPDGNPLDPQIGYFPFTLVNHSSVKVAVIPRGTHIILANNHVPAPLAYGAFFGIALLSNPTNLFSNVGFHIDNVNLMGNNTTYNGRVYSINIVKTGSDAFIGTWHYGPAYRILTYFVNEKNKFLTALGLGTYYLELSITIYEMNELYDTPLGHLNIKIPWAEVVNNYTGISYGYQVYPNP